MGADRVVWSSFLASPEPCYVKNSLGEYVDCNKAFAELIGLPASSICGNTDLDLPGKPSVLLDRHQNDVSFFKSQVGEETADILMTAQSSSEWKVTRKVVISGGNETFLLASLENTKKDEVVIPLWIEPLRSIYDGHPEAIVIIEKGRVRYANKAFLELSGYESLSPIISRVFFNLIDLSSHKEFSNMGDLKSVYREVRSNGSYRLESHLLSSSGQQRAVEIILYGMQGVGRRAYSVIFKDNQKLEQKEEQFDRIVKNMPAVIFRMWKNQTGDFGIDYISDRASNIYGMSSDQITRDPTIIFNPIVKSCRESFFEGLEESQSKLTPFHWQGEILNYQSELRSIQISAEPSKIEDRFYWDGIVLDRTEYLHMQQKLNDSEAISRQVFDNLPVGLFARSLRDGFKVALWNSKMEEIFGLSAEDTIGKQALKAMPMGMDTEVIFDRYFGVIRQKKPLIIEREEFEKPNGEVIVCRKILFPIFKDDQPIMVAGVVEDITESLEVLNVLERQKAQLERQSRLSSLGEVSASLAHEINNPLSIIIGYANQIQKLLNQREIPLEKTLVAAQKIEATGLRITKIVRGLKKLSRDGVNDVFEAISLGQLFEESLGLIGEKMRMSQISLYQCEFNDTDIIYGRPVEVSQILVNLVSNAIDALESSDEKWIRVSYSQTEEHDLISVEDSGPGIPEKLQEEILKPFVTTKEVGKGTGLGLSISKKIMETHGGELILDKASPITRFILKFPRKKVELLQAEQPKEKAS